MQRPRTLASARTRDDSITVNYLTSNSEPNLRQDNFYFRCQILLDHQSDFTLSQKYNFANFRTTATTKRFVTATASRPLTTRTALEPSAWPSSCPWSWQHQHQVSSKMQLTTCIRFLKWIAHHPKPFCFVINYHRQAPLSDIDIEIELWK